MTDIGGARDPARVVLTAAFVVAMVVATFWILSPFLPAAIWAATIAMATWPLMLRVQALLGGRRAPAVVVMIILLLLCLIVPLVLAFSTIVAHLDDITGWLRTLSSWSVPPAPEWLARLPLVGPKLAARWAEAAAASSDEISARMAPYTRQLAVWIVATVGSVGLLLVQSLLVVVFAAILYSSGETAAAVTRRFARRLGGAHGEHSASLAVSAIRGVALGIIVTAVVQGALAALGLWVAQVPFAAVLTAIAFVLCIAQLGPAPVLIFAVVWTYSAHGSGWGTALLVWSLFATAIDNVLRPILIRRGADLPLLLVFLGVVGGLLAFGIIGIFIGPVVLAVGYSLLNDWLNAPPAANAPAPAPQPTDHDLASVA